jgi:lipid II:glycine glycyltransferase (peptidoglycan interpeptide bridge formation enzyme)
MTDQIYRMDHIKTVAPQEWNDMLSRLPGAHILQTWQWSSLKADVGWKPLPCVWRDADDRPAAAAMVLKRSLSRFFPLNRMSILYVPKGPILDWSDDHLSRMVLKDLEKLAKDQGAVFIKIDPDIWLGTGEPGTPEQDDDTVGMNAVRRLDDLGWKTAEDQIQFKNTVMLDLTLSEADLLAAMKQKTRYNLNLAARKGVYVRTGSEQDFHLLYRMYAETSLRDGFVIRDESYYTRVWHVLMSAGMAQPFLAEADGEAVAALVLFLFAGRAYYFYGMSRDLHREKMPNYLLQWEAIKYAKSHGCGIYDFWGAPDTFTEDESMWGVYRFKRGLGGYTRRGCGAYNRVTRPALYSIYTRVLPRILNWMRRRGKEKTRQEVSP